MYVEAVPPPDAGAGGGGGGGGDGGGPGGPGGGGGVPAAEAVRVEEASQKGNGRVLDRCRGSSLGSGLSTRVLHHQKPKSRVEAVTACSSPVLLTHIPSRYITASAAIGTLPMRRQCQQA